MSRYAFRVFALSLFCLAGLLAQDAGFPVKRVVLYKNGVGYFEHQGPITGNQEVGISFTSGQLNDVLKSLTVLDLDGGRISGVEYGSSAPVDRQLGDLRLPVGEKTTLTEFLTALRGAKLEIHNGPAVVIGRLLSVERKTRMGSGATLEVDYVSLLTDSGEVKTTEVSPSFSVKLLEKGLTGKVDRFLDLLSSGRDADVRRMVVSTEGSGQRTLFVSYISEVPVWKATYRVVLSGKDGRKPLLQGWAIVDNTVGQDWNNVQLSLAAGAPQSFIQNLSQPYYSRRPTVALPQEMNISPQTYESTLRMGGAQIAGTVKDPTGAALAGATIRAIDQNGNVVAESRSDSSGSYELGVPEGEYRLEIHANGFRSTTFTGVVAAVSHPVRRDAQLQVGAVSETIEVSSSASAINTESALMGRNLGSGSALGGPNGAMFRSIPRITPPPPPPALSVAEARAQSQSAANGQELGDLFEYKLKDPVTIQKNRSALVPIVQAAIGAEKVSVWNERAALPRPLRALWLQNTSGLTLDGGSFSVLEENTFAGEGIFEPIRPDEKRLVSYATDLALNVNARQTADRQRISRVVIDKGIMTQVSEMREKKTYTFRNEDTAARSVIVEHPVRPGYELRGEAKPIETTAGTMRFRLRVEPKQTSDLIVEEVRPLQTAYALTNVTKDQVELFLRERTIDKTVEEALRKILAQKAIVEGLDAKKDAGEEETKQIFDDQQRLRENMKSLKGSVDEKALLQRYTRQLNDEEDRLDALKKEASRLEAETTAAQSVLDRMIQDLALDVKL
jgi:hypothetical protein